MMHDTEHISDVDLKKIVEENPTSIPEKKIESHVSNCRNCQKRMLELAGDNSWRSTLAMNYSDPDLLTGSSVSSVEFKKENSPQTTDRYELKSVELMLDEVLESPTHPELLGRIGRYDIESVIGCGGMGVVLKGFDRDLHRPIAIKMILPRLSSNGIAKLRFIREARAAAVVLHPNVIPIYGIDRVNDIPWFSMPLVVGPTLKELVHHNGPLEEREIVRIAVQIASGLAAAHAKGLVHRDIKPENILVDNQVNRVVITDFGLARHETDQAMTQSGFLAGTLDYMSPEQSRGEEVDSRSDLFSLGSLMYFLATGAPPFTSSSAMGIIQKVSHSPHKPIQSINNEISETLAQLVDRLLEKSPEARFQSAIELEEFLNEYLAHLQQPLRFPPPQLENPAIGKSDESASIGTWRMSLFVLSLLTAVTGAWLYSNWSKPNSGPAEKPPHRQ